MRALMLMLSLAGALIAQETAGNGLENFYQAIREVERIKIASGTEGRQTFLREYAYAAGDDDSRNAARTKALDYVRKELLDEVGVYLQSEFFRKATYTQGGGAKQYQEIIRQQVKELTGGITEMKVLDETWDGKTFRVKANITLDPSSVREGIMLALKGKVTTAEVERLHGLLADQDTRLKATQVQMKAAQDRLVQQELYEAGVRARVKGLEKRLAEMQVKLDRQEAIERAAQNEVEKIAARINELSEGVLTKIRRGMTRAEVAKLLGPPRGVDGYLSHHFVNYGRYWIYMPGDVAKSYVEVSQWQGPTHATAYRFPGFKALP